MDPSVSVCRLHPGVAVTGFCPACLRDRLAGLQPPSSADLRRCKSFSYARSAVSQLEPQRRSCDLFRQEQLPPIVAVPEEQYHQYQQPDDVVQRRMDASRKSSFGGLLGKKLQQWRRNKKKEPPLPVPEEMMPGRQHSFRVEDWSDRLMTPAAAMLSAAVDAAEEDYVPVVVPRSDGQIPVEEDYYYYHHHDDDDDNINNASVPGGCAQTRDYYLDSSTSSSRRRRSVDRCSTTSARNSFSDVAVNSELLPGTGRMTTNARVSPAMAAEFYHAQHQSVLVHHHQYRSRDYWDQPPVPMRYNDFSGGSTTCSAALRGRPDKAANKPKNKGIKGWSIWGLIQKKKPPAEARDQQVTTTREEYHPWPELRARGYNGQMLRCNSSISARSSFSGSGTAMSARRSISSAMEMQHDCSSSGRTRMELERNLSTRSSTAYTRSSGHDHNPPMGQFSRRPNHNGVRSSSKSSKPSALLPRRSTLGP